MKKNSTIIRQAVSANIDALIEIDEIAHLNEKRKNLIRKWVSEGNCFVVVAKKVLGYGVLDYSFYDYGFIPMLYVQTVNQKNGVGQMLLNHLESICKTEKLFTSTNESNLLMQNLLRKMAYERSGIIYNLDEGDPELIYYKKLHHE